MSHKRWGELTQAQQKTVQVGCAVELVLTTVALVDLARRPASQMRGAKGWWVLAIFVQPVGPIAYLIFGRQSS